MLPELVTNIAEQTRSIDPIFLAFAAVILARVALGKFPTIVRRKGPDIAKRNQQPPVTK